MSKVLSRFLPSDFLPEAHARCYWLLCQSEMCSMHQQCMATTRDSMCYLLDSIPQPKSEASTAPKNQCKRLGPGTCAMRSAALCNVVLLYLSHIRTSQQSGAYSFTFPNTEEIMHCQALVKEEPFLLLRIILPCWFIHSLTLPWLRVHAIS